MKHFLLSATLMVSLLAPAAMAEDLKFANFMAPTHP